MEKDRSDNIALIDLDGTVCDHDGALERDLNLLRSPSEPLINISKWRDKSKMPSHISSRTYMIRDRSCWWRDLPPIKQGMDLVGAMSKMGYRISTDPRSKAKPFCLERQSKVDRQIFPASYRHCYHS